MWIPARIVEYFGVNADLLRTLTADLSVARAERDLLRAQLTKADILNDFFRMKVNQLEMERVGLLEKAYGLKALAVPEVVRTPVNNPMDPLNFSFDHIEEDVAKKLGIEHLIS